jgi:uncharacterized membrane protein YgcG
MNRSILIVLASGLIATPALAQQPLQPQYPPNGDQGYVQPAQPQVDPYAAQPQAVPQQPMDPYAQYGEPDDEDDGIDVTYDISTSQDDQQYDDGYDPNAYQQFESTLSPYGSWQDVPDYGHVWVPSATAVGYDFEPYSTGGHFVMSDYGWTWVSDWDWGWAPFHYGRWAMAPGYGWCWLPGTHWGPAWVHWRWGGGYVGWAPMGPRGVVVGAPRGVRSPWHFTVANQLGAFHPHFLPARAVASVWRGTTPIHNVSTVNVRGSTVRFNMGPSSHLYAAATGRAIAPTPLRAAAPRALPNQAITPRVGTPVQSRPWMQNRGTTLARSMPSGYSRQPVTIQHPAPLAYHAPMTAYHAPTTAYRAPQPIYRAPVQQPYRAYGYGAQQPVYRAPAPQYHYNAPVQSYHPAPQYHYNAPVQSYHPAPQYHYSAPMQSFHAAPSYHYSAPPTFHSSPAPSFHSSGGFSGGGGFHSAGGSSFHGGGGFHGGGHR